MNVTPAGSPPATIHTAILTVMAAVKNVRKDLEVSTGRSSYKAASEAAFLRALRPQLIENGIHVYVAHYSDPTHEVYTTSGGSSMNRVTVMAEVVLHHEPSGTVIIVMALGEGADSGDKASNKAMTGALKYALRQTFLIETGDDPDVSSSDRQQRRSEPATPEKFTPPDWWGDFVQERKEKGLVEAVAQVLDHPKTMREALMLIEAAGGANKVLSRAADLKAAGIVETKAERPKTAAVPVPGAVAQEYQEGSDD